MRYWTCAVMAVSVVLSSLAAQTLAAETKTEVKHAPARNVTPASGKAMFLNYCAACHGHTAKGDGPAASAFNTPPADLTGLSKRNGGKFPTDRVAAVLRGEASLVSHGSHDMPVWGQVFWRMSQGDTGQVQLRVVNLTRYLKSLQAK
jgi:mono/diheme cytochrome c family protein